ncbi:hypothetical protein AB3X93_14305, partial [Paraburkholderia sp. BR14262]
PRSPTDAIRAGVFLAGEDRWRTSLFPDTVAFASIAGTISFPFLSRWQRGVGLPRDREAAQAQDAIETFGIRCSGPDDRVARLSGGNQQKVLLARWHAEPARLAGAPTARYRLAAYVASATIASLGGLLIAARVGRGDVSAGHSLLLDAVAAALVGYAVWGAKRPNVPGTVIGAVFVGVLLNGLTMLNAPYYLQDFIKGALLVVALAFTFSIGRRAEGRN